MAKAELRVSKDPVSGKTRVERIREN